MKPLNTVLLRLTLLLVAGMAAGMALAGSNERLTATGSSTVAPLLAELARSYESAHPDVRIDVQTGGSSRGVADAMSGQADIGMASRALKPAEQRLHAYTIARDGIAVIVHRDNPLASIDRNTVRKIYTGIINDWNELDVVSGKQIVVVNKAAGHSTLELFLDYLGIPPDRVRAHIVIGDNQQGLKTVAGNRAAIGYVSIGAALQAQSEGVPIKLITLDGIEPTLATVVDGSYPITRPLNLLTRSPAEGHVDGLLALARSADGHAIIESLNFVPVP